MVWASRDHLRLSMYQNEAQQHSLLTDLLIGKQPKLGSIQARRVGNVGRILCTPGKSSCAWLQESMALLNPVA